MVSSTVAAVMASHNRKQTTLRCLESLYGQVGAPASLDIYLLDDASSDGTPDAIQKQYPSVRVLEGSGELYWNGGMRTAFAEALKHGYEYYWWLNDDVELDDDALARLLTAADALRKSGEWPSIVVGSVSDGNDGITTYGGAIRTSRLRRFRYALVEPTREPIPADTMNGNCVLIPQEVAQALGNLSPDFTQGMGDTDYGLRAREAGHGLFVAPGTFGICTLNPPLDEDRELRRLWSTKELPLRPWLAFCRRWGGPLWPIYFVSPYLKRGSRLLARRLRSQMISAESR